MTIPETMIAAPPASAGRHVPFPLAETTHPLKLFVKRALGYGLCVLLPATTRRVDVGQGPADVTPLERLLLSALMHRAARRGEGEEFIFRQQRRFWSSAEIADFHAALEQYFEDMFLGENVVTLLELEKALAEGRYTTLCEIGSGHGRVI